MVKRSGITPICFTFLFLFLNLFSINLYSQTIYGLNGINHVSHRAKGPFFVQVGAYQSEPAALRVRQSLIYSYPIRIVQHGVMYAVIIGPIPTHADLLNLSGIKQINKMKYIKPLPNPKSHRIHKNRHKIEYIEPASRKWKNALPRRNRGTGRTIEWVKPQVISQNAPSMLIKLDVAAAFPSFVNAMYVNNGSNFPPPSNIDIFTTKQNIQPMVGLTVSKEMDLSFSTIRSLAFGLRYQYLVPQNMGGTITQYSLPEFLNYDYNWSTGAQVLTVESKINTLPASSFSPYINVGLGAALMQTSSYSETAYFGVTPRYSPAFASNTSSAQFAWHAGLGVDFDINPLLFLSVGYDFASYGQLASGNGTNGWENTKLELGRLKTNSAVFGLTYRCS